MPKLRMLIFLALALAALAGCSEDRTANPATPVDDMALAAPEGIDPEAIAVGLIAGTGWELADEVELPERLQNLNDKTACPEILSVERTELVGSVAHYTFRIAYGAGPYDVIGLHRVVKERFPYVPARTRDNLFMVHGDGAAFTAAFLLPELSSAVPADHACPIHLAENGVDVWGIDFAWSQVPADAGDLSFLADWGLDRDLGELEIGLAVARFVRLFSGHGFAKLHLMGWSRGGITGYAFVNGETQKPAALRHVKGFVPVDIWLRPEDPAYRESECSTAAYYQGLYDNGLYADDTGLLIQTLARLAVDAPDEASGIIPGLTNRQAALFFGSQTFQFGGIPEHYHMVGGTMDALSFMPDQRWFDFMSAHAPYGSVRGAVDAYDLVCGDPVDDVPWDDHLAQVTVPVLYVGANGGFGETGEYSTTLLGSTDVTSLEVAITNDPYTDFAHADLFLADDAEARFWEPLLDWLRDHRDSRGRP